MSDLTVVDPPLKSFTAGGKPSTPNPFGAAKTPKHDGPFISFPLSDDNVFELRLTRRVSKKDFERLKKLIDLSEDSLVEEEAFVA